jgi:Recombinase
MPQPAAVVIVSSCAGLFVPTENGRTYVPQIFARVIEGQSVRQIVTWLTRDGVPTATKGAGWSDSYIAQMIRNPVYQLKALS